jgi:uncharacterized membrane protein
VSLIERSKAWLDDARQHIPRWARVLVVFVAVALTIATWGPMLTAAVGIDLPGWEAFVHQASAPYCHQYPARSFHVAGHMFPLCARCTGMWLGITLGVALAMIVVPRHRWWTGGLLAVGLTAASGFDFLREQSGGTPHAWTRATLGFFLFVGVTLAVSHDTLAVLSGMLRLARDKLRGSR